MDNRLRAAFIWGMVCFLLLYRTLPSDVAQGWQLYQQFNIPVLQLIANVSVALFPALMPLVCFLFFTRYRTHNKTVLLITPFLAWLTSKFVILGVLYVIAVKSAKATAYAEPFSRLILRMITPDWLINQLVFALTIIVCSYACWRETRK